MGDFISNSWVAQVEELKATGIDTAAIAAILRERGASQREVASTLGLARTTLRRLLGEPGAERTSSNNSEELLPTAGPIAEALPPLTTAANLAADELKRAAQFQASGELEKASLLADRARVRGASEAQVRAALSALPSVPTPVAINGTARHTPELPQSPDGWIATALRRAAEAVKVRDLPRALVYAERAREVASIEGLGTDDLAVIEARIAEVLEPLAPPPRPARPARVKHPERTIDLPGLGAVDTRLVTGVIVALGLVVVAAAVVLARREGWQRFGELEPATDPGEIEVEALVSEIASQFGEAVDHLGGAVLV
jgi:DNA-binding XRE family transcriptional regulator